MVLPTNHPDQTCSRPNSSHRGSCLHPCDIHKRVSADEARAAADYHPLMFLIYRAHQCRSWRQGFLHEDENSLLRRELDALTNNVNELTDR